MKELHPFFFFWQFAICFVNKLCTHKSMDIPANVLLHFIQFCSSNFLYLLSEHKGPSTTTETETVAKYEIMDGAPVKGESIPIRLFLAGKNVSSPSTH